MTQDKKEFMQLIENAEQLQIATIGVLTCAITDLPIMMILLSNGTTIPLHALDHIEEIQAIREATENLAENSIKKVEAMSEAEVTAMLLRNQRVN